MKVKELISKLQKCNQESDILCLTEEEEFLVPGLGIRLFEINWVSEKKVGFVRVQGGLPTLRLNDKENTENVVFLEISGDL